MRAIVFLTLLSLFVPCAAAAESPEIVVPSEVPSLPIRQIMFQTSETLTFDDLARPLPLKVGDVLTEGALRESVEALYRREIFDNVDVRITARPTDVDVEFLLTPTLFVYDVIFSGNSALDDRQLRRLAGVRVGEPIWLGNILEAKERLLSGYRREGYFFSEVRAWFEKRDYAPQVIIHIVVAEGEPSRIEKTVLIGEIPQDIDYLPEAVSKRTDDAVASEANIKTLRREILLALRSEGYLQASVELNDPDINRATGGATLTAAISAHEPLSLVFRGNRIFTTEDLLRPLKLDTRTVPFTPSAIDTLCREIEKMYQAAGFYFAKATFSELPTEGSRRVYEVLIEEGNESPLEKVHFQGNQAFSSPTLLSVMETRAEGFWPWNPGRARTEVIASDQLAVESYYRDRGFLDVQTRFELIAGSAPDTLNLVVSIVEGSRSVIESVDVQWKGMAAGGSEALLTIAPAVRAGDPFSLPEIQNEQQRINDAIVARGYPNAQVMTEAKRDEKSVRYIVDPGKSIRIGSVWITGNTSVTDALIIRELEFSSGELLLPDRLRDSEQNLYRSGYFRSAAIEPADGALDEDVEDLAVKVAERDTGFVELGASLNTEDGLHLSGNLGQRNLGGEGQSVILGLDGFIKTGSEVLDAGNARALFTQPHVLGSDWNWFTEGFAQYSIELLDPYSYDRFGASTSFRSPEDERFKSSVGYSFFSERIYDVPSDVVLGPDDEGQSLYSFLTLQLDYDDRDNSFNPRSGTRSLFQVRYIAPWLGSDSDFFAAFFQESVYLPLDTDFVWANNFRVWYLEPLGDTDVIPLSQRVFLGGRNTLRGFSLNVVGPRGNQGNIAGGDTGINFNSELQYDLNESVVAVAFIDLGQAWLNNEGSFVGDPLDIDDLRYSPGVGVRYKTPIGPISAELGINPDREFGERLARFFLSVGGAF